MVKIMKKRSILLVLFVLAPAAFGYKTTTHVAITHNAITNSNLQSSSSSSAVQQLDLVGMITLRPDAPFLTGNVGEYIAVEPVAAYMSANSTMLGMENRIIDDVAKVRPGPKPDHSIESWILRGAIREDDNRKETPASEEPGGVITRVFGHFYDTKNDMGLTVGGLNLGDTAKAWSHTTGSTVFGFQRHPNVFNLPLTKEAMWRALTGLNSDGLDATPGATGTGPAKESVRKAYWATTFRSLGNAIHLIEDMAQPQHTRNDPHSGVGCVWGVGCLGGHDSFYEGYIGALTTKEKVFVLDETIDTEVEVDAGPELSFALSPGINAGVFKKYSDFFSSGPDTNATGKGLANYSSRGFYSAGTNVGHTELPLPDPNGGGLIAEKKDSNGAWYGTGAIILHKGVVTDTVSNSSDTAVLTATGLWHRFVEPLGSRSYMLNRDVYDDQARLLLPRAVAYSTAFINFFFRGKLVVSPPGEGFYAVMDTSNPNAAGFANIKVNLSAPELDNNGQPQILGNGIIRAVIKFRRRTAYQFAVDGCQASPPPMGVNEEDTCRTKEVEVVVSDPKTVTISSVPSSHTLNFPTPLPLSATDVRLQIVFRGVLGEESDEIIVATADMTEPTFWSYLNATDYFSIDDKVYTEEQIAADQSLIDKVSRTECIDSSTGTKTLVRGCLKPTALENIVFSVNPPGGGVGNLTVKVSKLEPLKFFRIALLGRNTKTESELPTISQPSQTCLPAEAVPVLPLEYEDYYSPGTQTPIYPQKSLLPAVRGAWQHMWLSCVTKAGGVWAGDNRDAVFKGLNDGVVAPVPVEFQLNGQTVPAWPVPDPAQ